VASKVSRLFGIIGSMERREHRARPQLVRQANGFEFHLFSADLGVDIRIGGEGKEGLNAHPLRCMGLYNSALVPDVDGLCPYIGIELSYFAGKVYTVLSNDDAVEIPLVVEIHRVPEWTFSDIKVESKIARADGSTPRSSGELYGSRVRKNANVRCIRTAECASPHDVRRITAVQRTEDRTKGGFPPAVFRKYEIVAFESDVAGSAITVEPANILDRDKFSQRHRSRFTNA
jgi:hypothetical protein